MIQIPSFLTSKSLTVLTRNQPVTNLLRMACRYRVQPQLAPLTRARYEAPAAPVDNGVAVAAQASHAATNHLNDNATQIRGTAATIFTFGYVRVSSATQTKRAEGHVSTDVQKGSINAFLQEQNWPVVGQCDWFEEVASARSGTNQKQMAALVRRVKTVARQGFRARVVVYDVTRFSRNVLQGLLWLDAIYKADAEVWFATERIQYRGYAGKLRIITALVSAMEESNKISQRVVGTRAYLTARGASLGTAPLGQEPYRDADGVRRFRPSPTEVALVAQVKGIYRKLRNKTVVKLRDALEAKGMMYRNKPKWPLTVLDQIVGPGVALNDLDDALPELSEEEDELADDPIGDASDDERMDAAGGDAGDAAEEDPMTETQGKRRRVVAGVDASTEPQIVTRAQSRGAARPVVPLSGKRKRVAKPTTFTTTVVPTPEPVTMLLPVTTTRSISPTSFAQLASMVSSFFSARPQPAGSDADESDDETPLLRAPARQRRRNSAGDAADMDELDEPNGSSSSGAGLRRRR